MVSGTLKLGLIGYPLGHSWSPQIHKYLIDADYQLWPLREEELDAFFAEKDFDGINVTIPYKQTVMAYLDEIDPAAKQIGAVNTIVNRNGKLYGYNTDYEGLMGMLQANDIAIAGRHVAILGSGGASKACRAAVIKMGGTYDIVSRTGKEGCITYEDMYQKQSSYAVLINTTPVGMYPRNDEVPVDLQAFTNLESVVDIIANPLRTRLQFTAKMLGLKYCGGFEMLVRQAYAADYYFTGEWLDSSLIASCMNELYKQKRNIVLIGMPTSGKTTVSSLLGKKLEKEVIEMDDEASYLLGTSIRDCFEKNGEEYFRNLESRIAESLREGNACIISCGGGVIKREENMRYLSENGIVAWIQRDLHQLYPTDSRPLSATNDSIKKMYDERLPLYAKYADICIDNTGDIRDTLCEIMEKTGEKV